jgi:hypothetical protein
MILSDQKFRIAKKIANDLDAVRASAEGPYVEIGVLDDLIDLLKMIACEHYWKQKEEKDDRTVVCTICGMEYEE